MVARFSGSRSRERLTAFIADHTSVKLSAPRAEPVEPAPEVHKDEPPRIDPNPRGEVLSLSLQNFKAVVKEGNVFVKFFAPWCVLSSSGQSGCIDIPVQGVAIVRSLRRHGRNLPRKCNTNSGWLRSTVMTTRRFALRKESQAFRCSSTTRPKARRQNIQAIGNSNR